jgi:hypothetical protein
VLLVQVQIVWPIQRDHPAVVHGDANPLVGYVAGAVHATRRGDTAAAEVDVVPLLGEKALVDAVEKHAAVLERHGRAPQQHGPVEGRRAGEEDPIARDIPARAVVLIRVLVLRRRRWREAAAGGGRGDEGGGKRSGGDDSGGADERKGGGEAGEDVREGGADGVLVRALVVPPAMPAP